MRKLRRGTCGPVVLGLGPGHVQHGEVDPPPFLLALPRPNPPTCRISAFCCFPIAQKRYLVVTLTMFNTGRLTPTIPISHHPHLTSSHGQNPPRCQISAICGFPTAQKRHILYLAVSLSTYSTVRVTATLTIGFVMASMADTPYMPNFSLPTPPHGPEDGPVVPCRPWTRM